MRKIKILWTDDEIDLLRAHILFLEEKGYEVLTAANGDDAIGQVKSGDFDIIFLDEHMPGKSGLETLEIIKNIAPSIPVVMVTKSEEEDIMDEAIGSRIADYLIKPVHPKQILLSIKKHIDQKRLVTRKTTSAYRSQFSEIGQMINQARTFDDWTAIYRRLVFWELELEVSDDEGMTEVLKIQKVEANRGFSRFITTNYLSWFREKESSRPLLSPGIIRHAVLPLLEKEERVIFIILDNLRYDQWKLLSPLIAEDLVIEKEEIFCSILPTATHYARNAIFAGLMPLEINSHFPELWRFEDEEGSKNIHEEELLKTQLQRLGKKYPLRYEKISNIAAGQKVVEQAADLQSFPLNVLVYNFVDILSHSRTEMEMIRELAGDEAAYRSLSLSWYQHSTFRDMIRSISNKKFRVVITTDHGSIRVNNAVKVVGDRETSTNLRYKTGKNLNYNPNQVFEISDPESIHLPRTNLSSRFIFAMNDDFLAYPKNYNYYANYYKNSFQHGGISMEEMLVPLVTLRSK